MSKLPGKLGPHVHPDVRVDATTLVLKNISKKWITAAKSKPPDKLLYHGPHLERSKK